MDIRIGHGYDVHALAEGKTLVIGGVGIEHSRGCVAHSDGDVLLHAVADAILGALALGDIGMHFPDTDAAFKGADSAVLLAKVMELASAEGYVPGNIDCTIVMQRPKLSPYIPRMREAIASVTGIPAGRVSVKATTEENLGFTGSEQGVAAHAVVLMVER